MMENFRIFKGRLSFSLENEVSDTCLIPAEIYR